jgi:predicted nuclease of predicted toxin-antitoxin system
MKLKLDENIPAELLDDLREAGHEADSVREEGIAGAPDPLVLHRATAEARTLLTLDKGIGDLRRYPPSQFAGIVLLRPPSTGRDATLRFARQHVPPLLTQSLAGRLVVVTERGLRWR